MTDDRGTELREKISFSDNAYLSELLGPGATRLRLLSQELGIEITSRGNALTLSGGAERVRIGKDLLNQLYSMVEGGRVLDNGDLSRAARAAITESGDDLRAVFDQPILVTPTATINPKSPAQRKYVDAIAKNDLVFGIGPAGTGKTYLAMAMALAALLERRVRRIILTRPAVEAGERLGFLPGDIVEKVNPYLRPLYDALSDMIEAEKVQQLMERQEIEVAPLAFMRGRTLNSAFVVLDEAQNTSTEQMLMFLTRLGHNSQAVVTGDTTQVDLPNGQQSGLAKAEKVLAGVKGIAFCHFSARDVVRHQLVQRILDAYQRDREGGKRNVSRGTLTEDQAEQGSE